MQGWYDFELNAGVDVGVTVDHFGILPARRA